MKNRLFQLMILFLFPIVTLLAKTSTAENQRIIRRLSKICQNPTSSQKQTLVQLSDALRLTRAKLDCQSLATKIKNSPLNSWEYETALQLTRSKPALLLGKEWTEDTDISGWWISEKLDGVRALWTGEEFVSRGGNKLNAPAWFTQALPALALDGELWMGRKKFADTISIVNSKEAGKQWKKLVFMIFDAPELGGTFEKRRAILHDRMDKSRPPYARIVKHRICEDNEDLQSELEKVLSRGGEGLMLRKPLSLYERKRSGTLLKVKPWLNGEAIVLEHVPGKGKHKGRLGAIVVETPDGIRFKIGTGFSDHERDNPPLAGQSIMYKYRELTKSRIPRFPVYLKALN